jgi:hypothetical protein
LQALFLCDDDETLPDPEDQEEQEEVEVPVSNAASVTVDARSILSSCSGDVSLGFEDQTVSDDTETIKIRSPKVAKINGVVIGSEAQSNKPVELKLIQILSIIERNLIFL